MATVTPGPLINVDNARQRAAGIRSDIQRLHAPRLNDLRLLVHDVEHMADEIEYLRAKVAELTNH